MIEKRLALLEIADAHNPLLTAALAGQVRTINVPKIVYEIPVVGGQREIVLGVQPQ